MLRSFQRERGFPYDQYAWMCSRVYGSAMRLLHTFGLHWRKPSGPCGEIRWCHWCGDRNRVAA
jgi:hypothetical protein